MSQSILEGSFASDVASALESAAIPYDLVLSREVTIDSPAPEPGEPAQTVTVNYPCRGFTDEYDASWRAGGLINTGDVKIIIIADTIEIEPAAGDQVTVRGKTYTAINVEADPAKATWAIQGRA